MTGQRHTGAIVVGIDGSEPALAAARWAAREAATRHCPLRLVTAFAWPPSGLPGDGGLGHHYHTVFVDRARADVDAAASAAGGTGLGVPVERHLAFGAPIPVLAEEAERAQLLVLGSRGLGGVAGLLVGSVTVSLAGQVPCPVVVLRGAVPVVEADARPVVVGVDGSPLSEAVLAFAFEAAAARHVPLVAVHAWQDVAFDPRAALLLDWDAIEADEQRLLSERLAGWGEKYPDVPVQRVVERARAADLLLDRAGGAQLVVVGSRGRGSFTGLVLGSIGHALLHRAPCPVAVVPNPVP